MTFLVLGPVKAHVLVFYTHNLPEKLIKLKETLSFCLLAYCHKIQIRHRARFSGEGVASKASVSFLGASHSPSRCGPEGVLDPGQTSAWNKVGKEAAEANLNKKDVLLHQFSFKTVSKKISSLETKTQFSLQENELMVGSCVLGVGHD